jgi:hypothetical protein
VKKGRVISQEPKPGVQRPEGSKVKLNESQQGQEGVGRKVNRERAASAPNRFGPLTAATLVVVAGTVVLPEAIQGKLSVELRPLAAGVSAALRGQPTRRRFTIETDEPHVKVAWRVRALGRHGDAYSSKPSKEET